MELFEDDFVGYHRISKKWAKLINIIRESNEKMPLCCVNFSKKYMVATDGRQLVRIEYGPDMPIKPGNYFMTRDRILIPVISEGEIHYPKMESLFQNQEFNKTATIELNDAPLLAMACAIPEFNSGINLDLLAETFEAIADLRPVFARLFGYDDERAKKQNIILEFATEEVTVNYLFKPMDFSREQFVKVDQQPCLFDMKKVG